MSPPGDGRSRPPGRGSGSRNSNDLGHEVPASVPPGTDKKPQRRKRLSADLPQGWLHDPAWWDLSDRAWRLHTHALMWCIGRTDGAIPASMLTVLLPDPAAAADELVAAGHWEKTSSGWQVLFWDASQSTVEHIEKRRDYEKRHKARQRRSPALDPTVDTPKDNTTDSRTAVPHGTPPGDYGTARNGNYAPRGTTTTRANARASYADSGLFAESDDVVEWRAAQ